jgi:hypothetical protein
MAIKLAGFAAAIFVFTMSSVTVYAGNSIPANVKALLRADAELNGLCRGGSGNDAATLQACEDRNAVEVRLYAAGWCYGKRGQAGFEMKWHKCTKQSLRPGD